MEIARLLNVDAGQINDDLEFEALSDALDNQPEPTTKPLPVQRHALCLSEDRKSMYLSGGQGDSLISSQLYCYNFETEEWTMLRDFVDRYDHQIIAYNRKIWAFGGLTSEMTKSSDVYWYDLDSDAVGYITISDDPTGLSYPIPSAATHYYTPGYPGTILDVSLPGFATEEYPLSVTAIDLVTLKRRNIVRPSAIFFEYTWLHIFSLGSAFVILGNLGNRQETNLEATHMFYWDLREFGFLDPHAQNEPDEREGTLSYDLLQMFRNSLLTDFEIDCVQGDQRPPLLHHVTKNNTDTSACTSTPSGFPASYNPYESLTGNTVLDHNSPAPSLHASEGLLGETDSVVDLAVIPNNQNKSFLQSELSVNMNNSTVSNNSASAAENHLSDSPSPTADSLSFHHSKSLKRQLTLNDSNGSRPNPFKNPRDGLPVFKLSAPVKTHFLILYSRWPHFRRIMQSGMSEARGRRIYIPEPVAWVEKLVEYMYTDSVSDYTVDNVSGLLILANLYELPRLRRLCLEHISRSSVTPENAVTVYWRAYLATETDLQKTAAAYCLQHWSQIVRTEKFETLPKDIMVMLCQEASSPNIIPKGPSVSSLSSKTPMSMASLHTSHQYRIASNNTSQRSRQSIDDDSETMNEARADPFHRIITQTSNTTNSNASVSNFSQNTLGDTNGLTFSSSPPHSSSVSHEEQDNTTEIEDNSRIQQLLSSPIRSRHEISNSDTNMQHSARITTGSNTQSSRSNISLQTVQSSPRRENDRTNSFSGMLPRRYNSSNNLSDSSTLQNSRFGQSQDHFFGSARDNSSNRPLNLNTSRGTGIASNTISTTVAGNVPNSTSLFTRETSAAIGSNQAPRGSSRNARRNDEDTDMGS